MLEARTVFDNVRDVAVTGTALAVWVFGIYKYRKGREGEHVLQVEVTADTRQTGNVSLVHVAIRINNAGKAAGIVSPRNVGEALCTIRRAEPPRPAGSTEMRWSDMQNLIPPVNYLADWPDESPEKPFIFEPNMTEVYHVVLSTDYHGLIWIRAELVDKDYYRQRGECLVNLT